jgi:diguanylate cyclase (GGDEF)-like protein
MATQSLHAESASQPDCVLKDRPELNPAGPDLDDTLAGVRELASRLARGATECGSAYATQLVSTVEALVQLIIAADAQTRRAREERHWALQEAKRWRRRARRLRRDAVRDPLTGAYNRGFFEEALATEFKRARRRCTALGLVFLDLDGFKALNDRYGHPFGDQVLRDVAGKLRREVRGGEVVARYGGDEFCIIISDTSESGLRAAAERLGQGVSALTVRRGNDVGAVSASVGVAVCYPYRTGHTVQELLAAADRAMYAAKTAGKDRVHLVSLLTEEESRQIEEVHRRRFGVYLVGRGKVSEQRLREAIRLVPTPAYCIGRLARKLGWISPRKLRQVLREQRRSRRLFGEIAVTQRALTESQLYALLALQRERPEDLAESLVDLGALTQEESEQELASYYQAVQGMAAAGNRSARSA